jgi:phosphoribosylaminoimidazole-succinocarboxamide synthase
MEIPGFRHIYSGKVRELYEPIDPGLSHLALIVASDRISAFDHILTPEIPGKGIELTKITNWWLDRIDFPNHRSNELTVPKGTEDRAVVVKRLKMYPVECVVRGYISGSGWKEYQSKGSICGIALPEGLRFGQKLPEPIFTPAFKAPQGQKDENITYDEVIDLVNEEIASELREASLKIFNYASQVAERAGLILADTKFEFGADPITGRLTLGDEVLTPDSSRYWDKEQWEKGVRDQSFDKQMVRNWLLDNWDEKGEPPALSPEIVTLTAQRYALLREKLTSVKL